MSGVNELIILGASDPEMAMIERLYGAVGGSSVIYATDESGSRVHPGNAYRAVMTDQIQQYLAQGGRLVTIECALPGKDPVIDHHRSGDPGHGTPPEEFMAASSIGQVISRLAFQLRIPNDWEYVLAGRGVPGELLYSPSGWLVRIPKAKATWAALIPRDLVLTAAADHCLGAAYRGECPGVDPDELLCWRIKNRAEFQRRSAAAVRADIEAAKSIVLAAPLIKIGRSDRGPVTVRDMRMNGSTDDARGAALPELPEAALWIGEGYIAGPLNTPDGRHKMVCSGTREQVEAFFAWATLNGVVDTYGDPIRGFAGGYLS